MREALVEKDCHLPRQTLRMIERGGKGAWVIERGGNGAWVIDRGGELDCTCTRYLVEPSCSTPLGDDL